MAPLLQPEKMAEPSASESSPETDRDFDPTAEMLVNDFDDERTLEEEEAMESGEDVQNELDDLQKEGDMPLEDLLAMYGYAEGDMNQADTTHSSSSEEILSNQDLTLDKEEIARDLLPHEDTEEAEEEKETQTSSVHELLDTMDASVPTSRLLRSSVPHHQSESESESEDEDYVPDDDDDWKKVTIQVGSDYQAVIPEGLCKYDDAPAYENDDKLLWDPSRLQGSEVDEYLRRIHQPNCNATTQGVNAVPTGSHVRDDEQALYLLLQCGHNIEEAHRRRRMQPVPPTDTMSLWSEEECRSFENGLRTYGKDFHLIQQNKVRTRSVGELVQFYYLWKKTERHDVFANKARLEKKKYTLHPGTTDYMDRFLDERENPAVHRDRSSSPNIHSLISGDHKRQHNRSLNVFGSGGSGCASSTHSPTSSSSSTINQHHHVHHHQHPSLHQSHHPHMATSTSGHFGVVGTPSDMTGNHTNPDSFQLPLEFPSPAITLPTTTSVTRINSISHPVSLGDSAHSSLNNSNNSSNSLAALDSLLSLPAVGSSLQVSPADNCLDGGLDPKNGLPVANLEDLAKNLTTHGIDRDSLESLATSFVTGASEFVGGLVSNSHFSLATTHHHLVPTLSSSSVATVTAANSELNHEPMSSLKNIEMSIASVNSLGSSISSTPLVPPASEALLHSASANPR